MNSPVSRDKAYAWSVQGIYMYVAASCGREWMKGQCCDMHENCASAMQTMKMIWELRLMMANILSVFRMVSQLLHSLCVETLFASRWDWTTMYLVLYYTTSGYRLWSVNKQLRDMKLSWFNLPRWMGRWIECAVCPYLGWAPSSPMPIWLA